MGRELKTTAVINDITCDGRLHLDSAQIEFSSTDLKWSAPLKEVKARADDDWLTIIHGRNQARFLIPNKIESWVDKILNPPDRMKKLGIKDGSRVWVSRGFGRPFQSEIKQAGGARTTKVSACNIAIWLVEDRKHLVELKSLSKQLETGKPIWIVWPKGSSKISQNDVMSHARSLGFGPSKTAAFDDAHSSMRFSRKSS